VEPVGRYSLVQPYVAGGDNALVGQGVVVLLALLAAAFGAIGIVVRQRATLDVPPEHAVSTVME